MSYSSEQWRSAVTRLLELTSKNVLRWEPSDVYSGDAWSQVDSSLMAKQDNRVYVISKTRSQYFLDDVQYVWQGGYNFSIYEKSSLKGYEHIATSPAMSSLSVLYDAAEGNMAFNRDALGGLLS